MPVVPVKMKVPQPVVDAASADSEGRYVPYDCAETPGAWVLAMATPGMIATWEKYPDAIFFDIYTIAVSKKSGKVIASGMELDDEFLPPPTSVWGRFRRWCFRLRWGLL